MSGRWADLHPVQRNDALALEEVKRVAVEQEWAELMDHADEELGLSAARAARDEAQGALLVCVDACSYDVITRSLQTIHFLQGRVARPDLRVSLRAARRA